AVVGAIEAACCGTVAVGSLLARRSRPRGLDMKPPAKRPADKSLREYSRKRDFARTPEPAAKTTKAPAPRVRAPRSSAPKAQGSAPAGQFVVQKHAARRLHYDLRLELDGTLKSWAVTRGPSLTVGEKRLAVRTEDHPVAYLDFEGNIPKGEY